mmetsp:Transcript_19656/g.30805  ORF Transcript_19656/g.30805 Transcript_19656/m.30805 type:complete len:159 (-) Transcript_19656:1116-1592(-)
MQACKAYIKYQKKRAENTELELHDKFEVICSKGMAVSLLLSLQEFVQTAYVLSDAKVRGFKVDNGTASKADKTNIDVVPPFVPSVLFYPLPSEDSLTDFKEIVEKLQHQMMASNLSHNEEPAEEEGVEQLEQGGAPEQSGTMEVQASATAPSTSAQLQ